MSWGDEETSELRRRLHVTMENVERLAADRARLKNELELAAATLSNFVDILRYVRQTNHQAHHSEGEPATCKIGTCGVIAQALSEI